MKKKIMSIILVLVLMLTSFTYVNAKEIKANDIETNAYVIGTHIFTGNMSINTSHIMLASKTIKGNDLKDMIIYYKTPKGAWINGATGESVGVPYTFTIEYIDLEEEIDKYKISYNLNGGTGAFKSEYYNNSSDFVIDKPIKEGYVFLGWTGSNGNTPQTDVTVKKGTTGNLEYTANWALYGDVNNDQTIDSHDLLLVSQYVEGIKKFTDIQKKVADVNLDGEIDDVDVQIIAKYVVGDYGITLPYESGNKYSISYNLNNGTEEVRNITTYAEISLPYTLIKPNPPVEGYVFLGWTGSNGNVPQTEVTIPLGTTGNLEYTANWGLYGDVEKDSILNTKDTTTIRRYINGFEDLTETQKKIADVNLDGEIDYVDVEIIKKYRLGYIETLPYDSGEKYDITYNLNGGVYDNYNAYAEISLPVTLPVPTKEGYAFIGWTGSNGDTPQVEVAIPKGTTGNLEYTANWGLYGDVDNDQEIDTNDVILINKYISDSENFTDAQKILADVNLDGEIDDVDVQIIFKYVAGGYGVTKLPYNSGEKYNITYNLDGSVNDSQNLNVYAEISLPFTLYEPSKEGYTFIGWTGSNGEVPQTDVTIEKGTTGDLEYIANWIANEDIPEAPTLVENSKLMINGDGSLEVVFDIFEKGAYENKNGLVDAELYIKDLNGYTLVEEFAEADLASDILEPGESNVYVARVYTMYKNTKVYSNYSNELFIDNENIITYDLKGGVNSLNNPFGNNATSSQNQITLEEPTKQGYTFLGWTGSNGDVPQTEVIVPVGTTEPLHYVANWERNENETIDTSIPEAPTIIEYLRIMTNKGSFESALSIIDEGAYDKLDKPINAELYIKDINGYTLVKESNDGMFSSIVFPGKSIVYVARVYVLDDNGEKVYSNYSNELLISNENIITYDLKGGVNSINNPFGYSGTSVAHQITLEEPTKYGYTFIGWTGSNGDVPQKEVTIEVDTTGALHYVANWEVNE